MVAPSTRVVGLAGLAGLVGLVGLAGLVVVGLVHFCVPLKGLVSQRCRKDAEKAQLGSRVLSTRPFHLSGQSAHGLSHRSHETNFCPQAPSEQTRTKALRLSGQRTWTKTGPNQKLGSLAWGTHEAAGWSGKGSIRIYWSKMPL